MSDEAKYHLPIHKILSEIHSNFVQYTLLALAAQLARHSG